MASDLTVQSAFPNGPLHVAIIMDGNGRWAAARELPRAAGHRAGVRSVRRVVRAAPDLGVGTLTLYAFSSDNWQRPETEVRALFVLLRDYLISETAACVRHGIRVRVIGRRDRLPLTLRAAVEAAEAATAAGRRLELRIAVDYSARERLLAAARGAPAEDLGSFERFAARLARADHAGEPREVDLLIRAGGEQRLSDFLLWECAYAELWFTRTPWPEFGAAHLRAGLAAFRRRERRFGTVVEDAAPRSPAARTVR